jgi:DNA replication protein DnaC
MMNQNQQTQSSSGECPVCHGTGWELYRAMVLDYGLPEEITFAQRCSKCRGQFRGEDRTGTPKEYHDADLTKFDFNIYSHDMGKMQDLCHNFLDHFQKWEMAGKGLYLWSRTPGSGKTFLACCLAKSVMMKYNLSMRFVTAPDYIDAVGNSYKRERGEEDPSQIYRECGILVLDDIGAQADKDWHRQEIFRLVNKRMEDGNITIYTSNMSTDALNVDARTRDRIIKTSIELQMPEESIRKKEAAREQKTFLASVMG